MRSEMDTEIMHQTLLQGESNQQQFFVQIDLLLNSKIYLEGILINGRVTQFINLREYIADRAGLNMSVPVIAALLLPKPELRALFFAILAEETKKEAESKGVTVRKLNRKYKATKDETRAQKDMFENPDIHKAALAGIALTNAQKQKMRKANKPPTEPMSYIRYRQGDLGSAINALSKKHSFDDMRTLPQLVDKFLEENAV